VSDRGMTEDQAESIVLAAEVGRFHGSRSELAHAILIIAARDKRWAEEQSDLREFAGELDQDES